MSLDTSTQEFNNYLFTSIAYDLGILRHRKTSSYFHESCILSRETKVNKYFKRKSESDAHKERCGKWM